MQVLFRNREQVVFLIKVEKMDFPNESSIQIEHKSKAKPSNFQQDTYKKSLLVLNQSSIALPNVGKKIPVHHPRVKESTFQLLSQNEQSFDGPPAHQTSILTAPNSNELNDSSIMTQKKVLHTISNSVTTDNLHRPQVNATLRQNLLASQQYLTQPQSIDKLQTGVYRNSSTVQKTKQAGLKGLEMQRHITNNSSSLMDPLTRVSQELRGIANQSVKNLPLTTLGGDYETSVQVLPVIGSEVSQDASSFKNISKNSSKVQLTKRDMQNFLVNGSIHKEFIQYNRKEIKEFIKNQGRASGEYFRGYESYGDNKDGQRNASQVNETLKSLDTINNSPMQRESSLGFPGSKTRIKKKLLGSNTIHVEDSLTKKLRMAAAQKSERLNTDSLVFADDVKVEKKIGQTSAGVSNRALETWINETLTDAYHLEIPGVLIKPEHKLPIHRYGIDRNNLVNSGISTEEVDRIYRSLFVYSVGFFEMLKKILSTTERNYQIITSIWKVYQVLLEYCCKTDYRILIAELSDKHVQELETIEAEFKQKIQTYIDTEKVLKQNMATMREYNDSLEKERATEKQLRLKLEEEYMQNTKNHEEEVKLRLKFEGKFNTMHDTHRELQIRHDRTLKEYILTQNELKVSEEKLAVKSTEFIDLQKVKFEQDTLIAQLKEYKQVAEKELKKKNMTLRTAEMQRSKATDNYELQRYEVQESIKDLNSVKAKMEIYEQQIEHLKGVVDASKLEKEENELVRLKIQREYQRVNKEFEDREGQIDQLIGDLSSEKILTEQYFDELEILRKDNRKLENNLGKLSEKYVEVVDRRKNLEIDNAKYHTQVKEHLEQLKKMNLDRHRLQDELTDWTERANSYEKQRDNALEQGVELRNQIAKQDEYLQDFRMQQFRKEEDFENEKRKYKEKIKDLEQDVDFRKGQVATFETTLRELQLNIKDSTTKGLELDEIINNQIEKISRQGVQVQRLGKDVKKAQDDTMKKNAQLEVAQEQRQDALLAKVSAEEIAKTYEETVKQLRRQLREEKEQFDQKNELFFITLKINQERDQMVNEEIVSRYGKMEEDLRVAKKKVAEDTEKVENYDNLKQMLNNVEIQRDQVKKELNKSKDESAVLENKLTDKDAEIGFIQEKHVAEIKSKQEEHNIEVNELEQKIQEERIEKVQEKNKSLKDQREQMKSINELQKAVRSYERGGAPSKGSRGSKAALMPEYVEAGVQTDESNLPNLLNKKHKGAQSQAALHMKLQENDSKSGTASSIQLPSESNQNSKEMPSKRSHAEIEIDSDSSSSTSNKRTSTVLTHKSSKVITKDPTSRESEQLPGTQTRRNLDYAKRTKQFIDWLVEEEGQVLKRVEKAIENQEVVHPSQIKVWRAEIRIPAMYKDIKLTEPQLEEVESLQQEQADYYRDRALRKIEEGSEYSSDFEQIEQSDYVTSDGEDKHSPYDLQRNSNIKVMRGRTRRQSQLISPRADDVGGGEVEKQGAKDSIGHHPRKSSSIDVEVKDLDSAQNEVLKQSSVDILEDNSKLSIYANSNKNLEKQMDGQDVTDLRSTAADKIFTHLRAQSARRREKALTQQNQGEITFTHETEENQMPVTQYVIKKDSKGQDVYKRRFVVQKRVRKERSETYFDNKRRALSARAHKMSDNKKQEEEKKHTTMKNMFSNFAANYAKTLDTLIDQSNKFLQNKALARRKIGQNDQVDNIKGRELNHFLVKQMKDTPAWILHLRKLKEELAVQEDKWDHREEERASIERKREEIRLLEEEHEREQSLERRRKVQIIHEDQMIKEAAAQLEEEKKSMVDNSPDSMRHRNQSISPGAWDQEAGNLINLQNMRKNSEENSIADPTAEIDQFSVWSEEQMAQALSQRDAQNPQGEMEEEINGSQLQLMLQQSHAQREAQGVLDQELQQLNKGGVAAINRQSEQNRQKAEHDHHQMQIEAEEKALQKDIILAQSGMMPKKKEESKKPAKLGPSSIRTLIRAAESRRT